MLDDGTVGVLEDANVNPSNLELWRTWERFLVVDAGNGKIALHNTFHNRFIRISGDDVEGCGGSRNACDLPPESEWGCERFTLVDAGDGKYAFHNSLHNRFMRMCGSSVDARGGPRNVDQLPPGWLSEQFEIIPHPISAPVRLFY